MDFSKKIKVIHFFGKMDMGGAETFIMNLYRELHNSVEFQFIVANHSKGAYDDEIIELGGKIHKVTLTKNIISYYKQIKNIVLKENIEIAHTHVHYFSGINAFILKKIGVKNVISHSHNIDDGKIDNIYRKKYRNIMKNMILNNSDYILACGNEAGKALYGKDKNYIVINNAINLDKFNSDKIEKESIIKELDLDINDFIIGHVGRFEKQKNHKLLIEIFENVLKKNHRAKLIMIGDGSEKKDIYDLCCEKEIINSVRFLGNRSDVDKIMKIFDTFLFPSLYEGLGIVLVEAQASGLKCIASNTIPKEVDLTGNVRFIGLQEDLEIWSNEVLDTKLFNTKNELYKYDIHEVAKQMYRIYSK
ncbi:glycosyltransferase family 1 protein [Clostridium thermobutyricum]